MNVEELFEPKTPTSNVNAFTQLFSLETSRAMRYQALFSIFLVGIDSFTDTPNGDTHVGELAHIVSQNLRNELRGTDLIGRVGKEIAVLLLHAGEEEATSVAERIQKRIEHFAFPGHLSGRSRRVTISIGAACFPRNGSTDTALLNNARHGLREAQRRGGNCYTVAGEPGDGATHRGH